MTQLAMLTRVVASVAVLSLCTSSLGTQISMTTSSSAKITARRSTELVTCSTPFGCLTFS